MPQRAASVSSRTSTCSTSAARPASAAVIREHAGLMPAPPRTPGGYRDYAPESATRLAFIRDAQHAGLTLAEIRGILALRDSGQAPCAHVGDLIDQHLEEITRRIAELRTTRSTLRLLARRAAETNPDTCVEDGICTIFSTQP